MENNFDNYKSLWFDAMVIEDGFAWIFVNNFNALFQLNVESSELVCLGSVPGEIMMRQGLYSNILKYDRKLVLIPALATSVAVYDLDKKTFTTVKIPVEDNKCFAATVYGEKVYMVGNASANVFVLDLSSFDLKTIDEGVNYYNEMINDKNMYFRKSDCVVDGKFYAASCISNTIMEIDMITDFVKFYVLSSDIAKGFRLITYNSGFFWIVPWGEAKLLKWDKNANSLETVFELECTPYNASEILSYGNKLLIYPTIGDCVIKYDIELDNMSIVNVYDKYMETQIRYPWGNQKFTKTILVEDTVFAFMPTQMSIIKHNLRKDDIEFLSVDISEFDMKYSLIRKAEILQESEDIDLKSFLGAICDER